MLHRMWSGKRVSQKETRQVRLVPDRGQAERGVKHVTEDVFCIHNTGKTYEVQDMVCKVSLPDGGVKHVTQDVVWDGNKQKGG